MAATYGESVSRKDGEYWLNVTLAVAVPELVVTTTDAGPEAVSSGAWRLICPVLTKERNAGLPLISTLVPPRDVGKSPFQTAVPLARLYPKIVTHSPGWITFP